MPALLLRLPAALKPPVPGEEEEEERYDHEKCHHVRQRDKPMLRPLTVLTVLALGVADKLYSERKSSSPMPSSISYNLGVGLGEKKRRES